MTGVKLHNLITLKGGPFDGKKVPEPDGRWTPILCEGDAFETGKVARYKPTRDPSVWRFSGYDTIVARVSRPGVA